MWVMDTDIALTSFTGQDGLNVFARSLQSAQPLAGLEVVLLTRGNEPVAKAITAADGRVNFAAGLLKGRGAAEAYAVMASDAAKQEFARLELSKAAFDFSDRGISGRDQPGPVDAFLYTERGVYRPGETVQLMAMLRDNGAVALANMPVTLIVKRPDGTEFTRFTHALQASGAVYQAIDLPKSSRRGRWSVSAHIDPKAAPVGRVEFSVEDFVPEKLKVDLTPDQPILRPGQVNSFAISARLPLWRAGVGPHGRGRHARHDRRPAVRRLRQILVRVGKRTQEVRAALHHAHRARYRRGRQDAPRMGRRQGQGHDAAAARADPGPRVRTRRRTRHARRQDGADAHPQRLSRHPSDLRGPLRQRRCRDGVRHRSGRRHRQAGRPTGSGIPHPAPRLCLPMVPGRRQMALAVDAERTAADHRHAGPQGRSTDAPVAPARLGRIQADGRRQREQHAEQPVVLRRLVRRQRRRGGARYAARRQRQAELFAGRERAAAHRAALRRRGAGRHRHRPHRRHLPRAGSRRRHDLRGADQGRMGRRRLRAGYGLAATLGAGRPHADPRHRRGLAGHRSRAAHARHADRRAREGDAAPAHRGAHQGRQPAERGGVRHPRRRR